MSTFIRLQFRSALSVILSGMFIAVYCLSAEAISQRRFADAPQMRPMERVQQLKKLRLMEELRLGEEESVRFFTRYNKFEDELRDLEIERNKIIDNIEAALRRGEKGEAFEKDFDRFLTLGQKVAEARVRFYNEVRKLLRPEQVAKLIVFERNFNRDLREMIQEARRQRWREMRPR